MRPAPRPAPAPAVEDSSSSAGLASLESRVVQLEARLAEYERAALTGGAHRRLTLRQAWEEGLLPRSPRTVEGWLADPELRARYHTEILVEQIAGRWETTPNRIEAWRDAMRPKGEHAYGVDARSPSPRGRPRNIRNRAAQQEADRSFVALPGRPGSLRGVTS